MAPCPCANTSTTPAPRAAAGHARAEAPGREEARVMAAMCSVCPRHRPPSEATHAGDRGVWTCAVDGRPTDPRLGRAWCPHPAGSRFPDDAGRVRWAGLTWRGVPMLLRPAVNLRARRERSEHAPGWGGCGCLDGPKRLTQRLQRHARAALTRMTTPPEGPITFPETM